MKQAPIPLAPGAAIHPRALTRHIGIFGATGTGKSTTAANIVQALACPVIVLDAKGDLLHLGDTWQLPRMDLARLGPALLSRALNLTGPQSGVLEICAAWAQDSAKPFHTLQDLRFVLQEVADGAALAYGLTSPQSVAAIQRAILGLSRSIPAAFGPTRFEPGSVKGAAVIHCADLCEFPGLYGAYAAHLLTRLYQTLGELGDTGAAGLMVLIDEAHLIFAGASPAIVSDIGRVCRLIRSKGVGLIWVTQSPDDLPDEVLGQINTRIQHGLRAGTMRQANAARAAAETMPGRVKADDVLGLGIGQAFVSLPDAQGVPMPAQKLQLYGPAPMAAKRPAVVFSDAPPPVYFSDAPPPAIDPKPRRAWTWPRWYWWPVLLYGIALFS
jgi:hypothetical protein